TTSIDTFTVALFRPLTSAALTGPITGSNGRTLRRGWRKVRRSRRPLPGRGRRGPRRHPSRSARTVGRRSMGAGGGPRRCLPILRADRCGDERTGKVLVTFRGGGDDVPGVVHDDRVFVTLDEQLGNPGVPRAVKYEPFPALLRFHQP